VNVLFDEVSTTGSENFQRLEPQPTDYDGILIDDSDTEDGTTKPRRYIRNMRLAPLTADSAE